MSVGHAVRAGSTQTPIAGHRPTAFEELLVGVTFFAVYAGLPIHWNDGGRLAEGEAIVSTASDGGLSSVVFGVLFMVGVVRLFSVPQLIGRLLREAWLPVAVMAWVLLSTVWSVDPTVTLRRGLGISLLCAYGYYVATRFSLARLLQIMGFAVVAATMLIWFWVIAVPAQGVSQAGNWTGVFDNKNILGRQAVLAVLVLYLWASVSPRWRLLALGAAGANVALVVGGGSATSVVALISLMAMMLIYRMFRARKTLFGAVFLSMAAAVVAAVLFVTSNLAVLTGLLDRDITLTGRVDLWRRLLDEVARRPLLGFGQDAYWGGWFSPSHEVWIDITWLPPTAHNAPLQYALELGLVGLTLFTLMFLQATYRSTRYVQQVPREIGLFPLGICSYALLFSVTEVGVFSRGLAMLLLIVAIVHVTPTGLASAAERPRGEVVIDLRDA